MNQPRWATCKMRWRPVAAVDVVRVLDRSCLAACRRRRRGAGTAEEPSEQRRSERIAHSGPRPVVNLRLTTPRPAKKGYAYELIPEPEPEPRTYPQPYRSPFRPPQGAQGSGFRVYSVTTLYGVP